MTKAKQTTAKRKAETRKRWKFTVRGTMPARMSRSEARGYLQAHLAQHFGKALRVTDADIP